MEFRQLRSFIALVECENFTLAASKIYVSQPTISTHLRILEDELQTQLVIRDTKKVRLTERGREFYDFAKRVVGLEDQLKQSWLKDNDHIHLGASTIPSTYLLPRALPDFLAKEPDTHFVITQADSSAVIDDVRSGIYDLGYVGMQIDDTDLVFTPVAQDRMVLMTPSTPAFNELQQEGPLTVEAAKKLLRTNRFIMREEGSGSGLSALACIEALGLRRDEISVAATVSAQESINNMVMTGVGVAIASNLAAEEAHATKGILVFDLPVESSRTFYLVSRKYAKLAPAAETFVRYLVDRFE
ncbi:MAG: LysR family transcriptional regulator [Eggerthellaceae bacterium]|nr:LysR family transcriptional regulator [Eggerthellaceae bacterium]